MARERLEEIEKRKGNGRLLDPKTAEILSQASYSLTRYQQFIECETFQSAVDETEGFKYVDVYITNADLSPSQSSHMRLELEDGRTVTGLFKDVGSGLRVLTGRSDFDKIT